MAASVLVFWQAALLFSGPLSLCINFPSQLSANRSFLCKTHQNVCAKGQQRLREREHRLCITAVIFQPRKYLSITAAFQEFLKCVLCLLWAIFCVDNDKCALSVPYF